MEIEKIGNKFKVAILAAKRAKQIMKSGKKKIDMTASNPLTIALEEIRLGLVTNETLKEDEKNFIINVDVDLQETANITKEKIVEQLKDKESTDNQKATAEEILKKNLTE